MLVAVLLLVALVVSAVTTAVLMSVAGVGAWEVGEGISGAGTLRQDPASMVLAMLSAIAKGKSARHLVLEHVQCRREGV